jgi:hypothetical protein
MKKIKLILVIGIILIIFFTLSKYNTRPENIYSPGNNLITDGSFEHFDISVKDCCINRPGIAQINSTKNKETIFGKFCLELNSKNHCACVDREVLNFSKENLYFLTFHYKGDNPRFCSWFEGDEKCLPNKKLETTNEWTQQKGMLFPTENTEGILIYFYADSHGETVTNLYDDLQVRKLIEIDNNYEFKENEEYIIKTKADNNVNGERISEIENGEAYFLTKGEPKITIKFPITELITILIMLIIIIRLTKHEKH